MGTHTSHCFTSTLFAIALIIGAALTGCGRKDEGAEQSMRVTGTRERPQRASAPAKSVSSTTGAFDGVHGDVAAYNQILDAGTTGMLDAATLARGASFEFLRRQAWDAAPVDALVYAEAMLMKARTPAEEMGACLLISKYAIVLNDFRRAEEVLLAMRDDQSSKLTENLTFQKYSELQRIATVLHGYHTSLTYCTTLLSLPQEHEQPITFRVCALNAAARACCVLNNKEEALRYAREVVNTPDPQGVLATHKMTAQEIISKYENVRQSLLADKAEARKEYDEYRKLYEKYGDKTVDYLMRRINTDDPRTMRAALLNKLRFAKNYVPPKD